VLKETPAAIAGWSCRRWGAGWLQRERTGHFQDAGLLFPRVFQMDVIGENDPGFDIELAVLQFTAVFADRHRMPTRTESLLDDRVFRFNRLTIDEELKAVVPERLVDRPADHGIIRQGFAHKPYHEQHDAGERDVDRQQTQPGKASLPAARIGGWLCRQCREIIDIGVWNFTGRGRSGSRFARREALFRVAGLDGGMGQLA
jgi:hypothetical protein